MAWDKSFKNKICVVTGAGSGIGRAVAIRLSQLGAKLALCDISDGALKETLTLLDKTNVMSVSLRAFDVASAQAIKDYALFVEENVGPADYLFNIAGLARVGTFDKTPLSSFEKVMDVNFYGPVRLCKAFLDSLKQTQGAIINISSVFGMIGFPGQTHYCASKFAIRGFSETLAQELEPLGVFVSSVHPGGVATNIARSAEVDALPNHGLTRDEMNAEFDKAAITSPEKAAEIILKGAAKRKRRILVGADAGMISLITRFFPVGYARILKALQPDTYKAL